MTIGSVEVRVQTEERLRAINALAAAIETLARALGAGTHVSIENCRVETAGGPGISVSTTPQITRTEIVTDDDKEPGK